MPARLLRYLRQTGDRQLKKERVMAMNGSKGAAGCGRLIAASDGKKPDHPGQGEFLTSKNTVRRTFSPPYGFLQ